MLDAILGTEGAIARFRDALILKSGHQITKGRLRWQLEFRSLSPAELEGNAALLSDTELFETLQARRALLRQHPSNPLRALHQCELERLSANLPMTLRESFVTIHH